MVHQLLELPRCSSAMDSPPSANVVRLLLLSAENKPVDDSLTYAMEIELVGLLLIPVGRREKPPPELSHSGQEENLCQQIHPRGPQLMS
jgi:hypothetical protein